MYIKLLLKACLWSKKCWAHPAYQMKPFRKIGRSVQHCNFPSWPKGKEFTRAFSIRWNIPGIDIWLMLIPNALMHVRIFWSLTKSEKCVTKVTMTSQNVVHRQPRMHARVQVFKILPLDPPDGENFAFCLLSDIVASPLGCPIPKDWGFHEICPIGTPRFANGLIWPFQAPSTPDLEMKIGASPIMIQSAILQKLKILNPGASASYACARLYETCVSRCCAPHVLHRASTAAERKATLIRIFGSLLRH